MINSINVYLSIIATVFYIFMYEIRHNKLKTAKKLIVFIHPKLIKI
jgi:hypothetical protein